MKLETFTRDSQYLKVILFLSNKTEHFLHCSNSRNLTLMLVLFEGPDHPDTLMKIGKLATCWSLADCCTIVYNRRTTEVFRNINRTVKRRLLNIYKFDFVLFSYSWEKYF